MAVRLSKEFRLAASFVSRGWAALSESQSDAAAVGYLPNVFGSYWLDSCVEKQVANLRRLAEQAPDENERAAALFSLAGLLHQAFRLGEAESVCSEVEALKSVNHPPIMRLRAEIEARKGNLAGARAIARELANDPKARFFCISDEQILAACSPAVGAAP